jgi:hypothetical protein
MNDRLDQLDVFARRAAADLDSATGSDADHGLGRVYHAHTRHRSHVRLARAAVVLAALTVGWFVRGAVTAQEAAPIGQAPSHHIEEPWLCTTTDVTCLGNRTYRIAMVAPVSWYFPPGFGHTTGSPPSRTLAQSSFTYRRHVTGVTIVQEAGPAGPDGRAAPGVPAQVGPKAFAQWLVARPFLTTTTPVRTTIGGRPAWRVRARLSPEAGPGPERCVSRYPCHPVTISDGGSMTGIWEDMVAEYTFVSLPSGTGVIWSWAFGGDTTVLDHNRALVDGISWPTD